MKLGIKRVRRLLKLHPRAYVRLVIKHDGERVDNPSTKLLKRTDIHIALIAFRGFPDMLNFMVGGSPNFGASKELLRTEWGHKISVRAKALADTWDAKRITIGGLVNDETI